MKTTLLQIRVSPEEKALYAEVAKRLQRNLSDAVRFTMREKLQALKEQDRPPKARGAGRSQVTS